MTGLEESPPETSDPETFDAEGAEIDASLALRAAFSEVLAEHGFADTLVLGRERAEAVFHDRRPRILDYQTDRSRCANSLANLTSTRMTSVAIYANCRNSR